MPGQQLQHVVEKANAAADLGASVTFERERDADFGFVGLAMDAARVSCCHLTAEFEFAYDFSERADQPVGLRVASDGDAYATFAAGVGGAVANQNSALPHCRHELTMLLSNPASAGSSLGWANCRVLALLNSAVHALASVLHLRNIATE